MSLNLTVKIETVLQTKVLKSEHLPVGFGLEGRRIELADGRRAAVKACVSGTKQGLEIESYMLRELKAHSNLPVPEVYYYDESLLIMQWMGSGGTLNHRAQQHAAELLAELHQKPFPQFGYERDSLIGPLHQPNPPTGQWVDFFRDHRLLYMAQKAVKENALPQRLFARLEKLADRLENHLGEPAHPSLLHGDLWSGNIIASNGRIRGLIDPAIYCGHPEIELAFTTLFGTFGKPFFEAYESLASLDPGFHEERCAIYNLYPLLVHVRLFGASYLSGIDQTLRKLEL